MSATERRPARPRRLTSESIDGAGRPLDSHSYDYAIPDEAISPWLKCAICLNPFVDPHVSRNCQHTFCFSCINQHLEREQGTSGRSSSPSPSTSSAAASRPVYGPCPECRTPVRLSHFRPAALLVRNMVDALLVRCPYAKRGCSKVVERSLLAGHKAECGWGFVGEDEARAHERGEVGANEAPGKGKGKAFPSAATASGPRRCTCGAKVLRKDWEEHQRGESCSVPWVECAGDGEHEGCGAMLSAEHLGAHLQSCPAALVTCQHCAGQTRRSELSAHVDGCPEKLVGCLHASFGCTWTGTQKELGLRSDERTDAASGHLATCPLALLAPFLARQQAAQEALARENHELRSRVLQLEGRTDESERQTRACVDSLGAWFVPREEQEDDEDGELEAEGLEEGIANIGAGVEEGAGAARAPAIRRASTSTSRWVRATQPRQPSPAGPASTSRQNSIPAPQAAPLHSGARTSPGIGVVASHSRSAPGTASDALDHWPWDELERQSESRSAHEGRTRALSSVGARSLGSASAAGGTANGLRLESTLGSIAAALASISKRLDSIEVRVEESARVAAQGASEASRALDECGTARHALHGMRMQLHQVVLHQHHQQAHAQQQHADQQQRRQRGGGEGAADGASSSGAAQDPNLVPMMPLGPDGAGGWGMTPPLPLLYGHGGPGLKAHPHHPMPPQGPHPPPPLVGLRRWGIEQVRL